MAQRRKVSIADVRRTYSPAKSREEWFGDWASALAYRPISFLITPSLIALGISARTVTLASLAIGLSLPLLAQFADHAILWLAGLAVVWVVLDCVDGNIARVTGTASPSGHYLDFATDLLFRCAHYAAIGLLADRLAGTAYFHLTLSLFAAYIALAARFCRQFHAQHSGIDVYEEGARDDRPRTWPQMIFSFLSGLDRTLPFLVLAGGLTGRLGGVVLFLVVYSGLDLLYSNVSIARKLTKR